VSSGGFDFVQSGGVASSTVILAGGNATVMLGGTVVDSIVSSGGIQTVSSGGTLSGATLSGGFLEIQSGGTAGTSMIGFGTLGGTLELDDSQHFNGVISGFGVPGGIDLTDISYGSGTTVGYSGDNTGGILTVTDGSHTATLSLLGQYVVANFAIQSDGHGGTLVVDPPVADQSLLYNVPV
jgi:autotransporter passenger strand-loop-strand repeat protein